MPPYKGLSHSMRSGDWMCPRCNSFQFGQNMACRMCSHAKPTLKTLGQRCFEYYPLSEQRRKFEGERHCPDCHAIIHQSHSQCLACRDRPLRPEYQDPLFNPPQGGAPARGVLKAPGGVTVEVPADAPAGHGGLASFSTGGAIADLGAPITASASIPASQGTAYGALCDHYAGMSPEEVLADLERKQEEAKGPTPEQLAAEAERLNAKREREAAEAETARAKAAEDARLAADRFEADRARTRSEAELRIQAMLDADEREAGQRAVAGEPPAQLPAEPPAATETEQAAAGSRSRLGNDDAIGDTIEAERPPEQEAKKPRKESKEERKRKKEEAEQEQRKRMRERRLARNAAAVVIDGEPTPAAVFL